MNQSTELSVCAIMLTANRPEYARRAVECFRTQTYGNKRLLILDSTDEERRPKRGTPDSECYDSAGHFVTYVEPREFSTIGALRNKAGEMVLWTVPRQSDILIHWDDDDYSHPNRIAEQVAILQSSCADCVGYNEMLLWREPPRKLCAKHGLPDCSRNISCEAESIGEAWLYRDRNPTHALGTSLCYWRSTWERKPFEATSRGEDYRFTNGLKVAAVSSIPSGKDDSLIKLAICFGLEFSTPPRMIARIHWGNTSTAYSPEKMNRHKDHWTRVPAWDQYCRETMEKTCA